MLRVSDVVCDALIDDDWLSVCDAVWLTVCDMLGVGNWLDDSVEVPVCENEELRVWLCEREREVEGEHTVLEPLS